MFGNRPSNLLIRPLGTGRLNNKSLGDLAGRLVGNLDDGAVRDEGVRQDVGFQLGRRDLVALEEVSTGNKA